MFKILIVLFVVVVSLECSNGNAKLCYEAESRVICYFQPNGSDMTGSWRDASQTCKKNNSTLPVIRNERFQEKVAEYLKKMNQLLPSEIWLAGREIRTSEWLWLNGEAINNQAQVKGAESKNFAVLAKELNLSSETQTTANHYICRYRGNTSCQSAAGGPVTSSGKDCIVIYNDNKLNFTKAREKCLDGGGDLATFEDDEDLTAFKTRSMHLLISDRYWIGLSRILWKSSITEQMSTDNFSSTCRYMKSNDTKWHQVSCNKTRGIMCQTENMITLTVSTVKTLMVTTEKSTDDSDMSFSKGLLVTIIGGGLVIIVAIIGFSLRKLCRKKATDKELQQSDGNQTQKAECKAANEMTETCGLYAEITLKVHDESHSNNTDEGQGNNAKEPQTGVEYATLEFASNKEKPTTSSLHEHGSASIAPAESVGQTEPSQVNALDGNIYAEIL